LSANNTSVDTTKLLTYVKKNIVKNPQVRVKGIRVNETVTPKTLPDWKVVFVTMNLEFQKQEVNVPEMFFIDKNGLITTQLGNLETGEQYRNLIRPSVPDSIYDEKHLLFGNKDAEHKVVVFSDPMCPFCRQEVPAIFKAAKEHPDKIALYYYHLPLRNIHPVSDTLTKIMHQAQKEGKTDVVEKMYSLKIPFKQTNVDKIIEAVKKHTGYEVSKENITSKEAAEAIKHDEEMANRLMVRGTPAFFVDGKWDSTRKAYQMFVK
jgi:protein-disulfide isomerase